MPLWVAVESVLVDDLFEDKIAINSDLLLREYLGVYWHDTH